jgi:hypothetical protein
MAAVVGRPRLGLVARVCVVVLEREVVVAGGGGALICTTLNIRFRPYLTMACTDLKKNHSTKIFPQKTERQYLLNCG